MPTQTTNLFLLEDLEDGGAGAQAGCCPGWGR
jgi:hypothetical protein